MNNRKGGPYKPNSDANEKERPNKRRYSGDNIMISIK